VGSRRSRSALGGCVAVALALLAGCSLGPDVATAAGVAGAFHAAVADGDGLGACELLSLSAIEELERSAGTRCDGAIEDEQIPEVGEVVRSAAYGHNAQVVFDGDTVFLSIFDGEWRVVAAGCTARGEQPYNCMLSDG
jgi:hypothetical protein